MKRIFALTLSAALALSLLSGCSNSGSKETVVPNDPSEAVESVEPTATPTPEPSVEPTAEPSEEPSQEPSVQPSQEPSKAPEVKPIPTTPAPKPTPTPAPKPTPTPAPKPTPTPAPKPTPTPAPTPTPEPTSEPAGKVDLAAFYSSVTSQYEFGFLELASTELMDGFYPGLSAIAAEQRLVYITQMSMNNGEFGLVQVKNSADVAAVKAVFQARIDYMVGDGNGPGGAWYPGPTEQWQNNSRVVSNGNYVMMVVHENCDDIVAAFNALF